MKFLGRVCVFLVVVHFLVIPLVTFANRWYLNNPEPLAYTVRMVVGELWQLGSGRRSIDWIEDELQRTGVPFQIVDGDLLVQMPTHRYRNRSGDNVLKVFIEARPSTGTIVIELPYVFQFAAGYADQRVAKLPALQYGLTLLQLDYDPRDGEVRGRIQLTNFQPRSHRSFHELFMELRAEIEAIAPMLNHDSAATTPPRDRRGQLRNEHTTSHGGVGI